MNLRKGIWKFVGEMSGLDSQRLFTREWVPGHFAETRQISKGGGEEGGVKAGVTCDKPRQLRETVSNADFAKAFCTLFVTLLSYDFIQLC